MIITGNIRPTYIKHIAKELINKFPDKFVAAGFQYNKEKAVELTDFDSIQSNISCFIYSRKKQIYKKTCLKL